MAQWKAKLAAMSEDQIGRFLVSETFAQSSPQQQNLVHSILEEEGWTLEAEVDLNIERLDEREAGEAFELPEATAPMPWETRPEVEDDGICSVPTTGCTARSGSTSAAVA